MTKRSTIFRLESHRGRGKGEISAGARKERRKKGFEANDVVWRRNTGIVIPLGRTIVNDDERRSATSVHILQSRQDYLRGARRKGNLLAGGQSKASITSELQAPSL